MFLFFRVSKFQLVLHIKPLVSGLAKLFLFLENVKLVCIEISCPMHTGTLKTYLKAFARARVGSVSHKALCKGGGGKATAEKNH